MGQCRPITGGVRTHTHAHVRYRAYVSESDAAIGGRGLSEIADCRLQIEHPTDRQARCESHREVESSRVKARGRVLCLTGQSEGRVSQWQALRHYWVMKHGSRSVFSASDMDAIGCLVRSNQI